MLNVEECRRRRPDVFYPQDKYTPESIFCLPNRIIINGFSCTCFESGGYHHPTMNRIMEV